MNFLAFAKVALVQNRITSSPFTDQQLKHKPDNSNTIINNDKPVYFSVYKYAFTGAESVEIVSGHSWAALSSTHGSSTARIVPFHWESTIII